MILAVAQKILRNPLVSLIKSRSSGFCLYGIGAHRVEAVIKDDKKMFVVRTEPKKNMRKVEFLKGKSSETRAFPIEHVG